MRRTLASLAAALLLLAPPSTALCQALFTWPSHGYVDPRAYDLYVPAQLGTDTNWANITTGGYHMACIRTDGTLWTWGYNYVGGLGLDTPGDRFVPTQVGTDTNWTSTAAEELQTLALKSDGTLWSTGCNWYGQLGLGDYTDRYAFTQVGADTNWAAVVTGHFHSLALKSDATLWAWGDDTYGQVGLGGGGTRLVPTQVGTDTDWTAVAAGKYFALALKSDGTLWAWGANEYGQLGLGDTTNRNTPTQVGADTNWAAIACGRRHSLALKSDGTLWAWGENEWGQVGVGDAASRLTPVQVGTDTDWATVQGGYRHTVAMKSSGSIWTWGANDIGQLGVGDTTNRYVPTQVGTDTNWISLKAGYTFTAALRRAPVSTIATVTGTAGTNGWYRSDLTVELTATDHSGTGIAGITYQLDGGLVTSVAGPTATLAVTGDGTHVLLFSATDNAGNAEPLQTLALGIDTVPPGATSCWLNAATARLSSFDATSGVASITYSLDGGPQSAYTGAIPVGLAAHTLTYFATDNAGNQESTRTTSIPERRTATRIWVQSLSGAVGDTLTLQGVLADSANNRLVGKTLHFSVDGTEVGTGVTAEFGYATCPFAIPAGWTGTHTISVAFTDTADPSYLTSSNTGTLTLLSSRPTSVYVPAVSGAIGDTVKLLGRLIATNGAQRLSGQMLSFSVGGSPVGTGVTDSTGYAICPYTITAGTPGGTLPVAVAFGGAGDYAPSLGNGVINLLASRATALYVPPASGAVGDTIQLMGCLYGLLGSDKLSGQTLVFKVNGVSVGTAVTDGDGYALCGYTITSGTPGGTVGFTVEFAGATGLAPSSGSSTITILALRQTTIYVVPVTAAGGTSTYLQACLLASKGYDRLIGKVLHFSLGGVYVGDATTAAWGYATLPISVPAGTGPLAIDVTFDGDGVTWTGATGQGTLTRP